ncbi:Ppx/GppA phosphatase family protein [Rhizobium sp. SL86]|uniref:Ppx/GppA phosphatase family protein n=1 Tax=Rhizobium sp. SL86 TaxID=2995148 RepID=UPI002275E470|nr:Ppx/GppA phosphatase family protein [Rhizobium sp. SL86]MCY1664584.1 Ppx/GppA phosphatase family protein [Rhizobium sp. SL86]
MNPDSGGKPPEGGASADNRPGGKAARRRKGKRGGKPPAAVPVVRGSDSIDSHAARRPETQETKPPRKRKRRRARAVEAVRDGGRQPSSVQDAVAERAPQPSQETPGSSPQPGAGRRRNRGKKKSEARGPQGRPLVPHGKPQHGKGGGRHQGHQGHHGPASKQGQTAVNRGDQPPPAPSARSAPDHRGSHYGGHHARPQPDVESADSLRRRSGPDDLYAALDLGTNNCRLLIAQPTRPGQFRVVDAFSRIVRLGEGLARTGRLSSEAMDRAVEALRVCAAKLATRQIRKMRLIATEACRAAANGEEFLERVTRETGLKLEIIDRETEARLAVSGCSSLVGREARSVVLFDIGGGSSEIAVIRIRDNRSSRLANHITHWTSLPVGVVTLSERHGGRNVTPDVFAAMVAEVETMLEGFHCPGLSSGDEDFHLIGTSGTVTTLAGVHLDLPRYDRRKVDGLWLSDQEVSAMQAKLLSWDFEGRASNPCIGPDRADLVLAGCAILEAIRRRWPSRRMRVADRGLREGLLTDMMADDGVWRRLRRRQAELNAQEAPEKSR